MRLRVAATIAGLLFGSSAQAQGLVRFDYREPHMGTWFRIVLYAPDSARAGAAASEAFSRIDGLNARLSDYLPGSELTRLSATAGSGRSVPLSTDLHAVLVRSQEISRLTDGAFDVTVGPLTRLWRRARRRARLPPEPGVREAMKAVGYANLVLADSSAMLLQPGMRLDLGAIAKGYAADEALRVLAAHGIVHALVDAGGDIAAAEAPPDSCGWSVALPGKDRIRLARGAVASSGPAFRYIEEGGIRHSHILDPRTGSAMTDGRAVVVMAPAATDADAFSSAFSVMEPQAALRLADKIPGVSVRMMLPGAGEAERFSSSGFGEAREIGSAESAILTCQQKNTSHG